MKQLYNKSHNTTLVALCMSAALFFSGLHLNAQKLQGLLSSAYDEKENSTQGKLLSNLPEKESVISDAVDTSDAISTTPAAQNPAPKTAQENIANNTSAKTKPISTEPKTLQEKITQDTEPLPAPKKQQQFDQQDLTAPKVSSQKNVAPPASAFTDTVPSIEFHFENTDLSILVSQIEEIFHVKFISDEALNPLSPTGKAIKGNKISFKTQEALTKKQAWNLFLNFLDLATLSVAPTADPRFYKILSSDSAYKAAIPSYIGVDPILLPDNDAVIRYVYFLENSSLDAIKSIIEALRNQTASVPPIFLQDSKAFILTDKSYNIKMLMQIVKELDKASMPQTLSVLKLRRVDAVKAKALYEQVSRTEDQSMAARLFPARRQPTSLYFPENARVFAEPRTNTLILLGPKDAVTKIEEFITRYIDVDLNKPYSPLYVYPLKYADATTVANILSGPDGVLQFGKNTEAGKHGGVRGEDKYFKNMSVTPDKETNRLVIRGEYDDYLKIVEIIEKLDEPQPQIGIEVLILSININEARQLGTQLRSKVPGIDGLVGNDVKFQTSGLAPNGVPRGIVENPSPTATGAERLLGNLINLAVGAQPGNTIISLGTDVFGVWGIFQALETLTSLKVVANPFLTAVNNYPASVDVGEIRRVTSATVIGGNTNGESKTDYPASLNVAITPQINSDGMIVLDVKVTLQTFLDTDPTSARTSTRSVKTKTIVSDREVLALGGLIQNTVSDSVSKVPILGDIPILGWLFKNKQKKDTKNSLLILISSKIVKPDQAETIAPFTQDRIQQYRSTVNDMQDPSMKHDPVTKLFFKNGDSSTEKIMDEFMFKRQANGPDPIIKQTQHEALLDKKRRARKRQRSAKNKKTAPEAGIIA